MGEKDRSDCSRGQFFQTPEAANQQLYSYQEVKDMLPQPIIHGQKTWLDTYWYAWEVAFRHAHVPSPSSGLVSNFVDAAFNEDLFLWDTAFITMFADFARPYLPGIQSLDNFYAKQLPDGSIPREFLRETGEDMPFWVNEQKLPLHSYFHNHYGFRRLKTMTPPKVEDMYFPDLGRPQTEISHYTLDNLNHPILAWAEWVSFQQTGNLARLTAVFMPLYYQFLSLKKYLQHQNGLYVTDWASMDNSPRNRYLGCGLDISSEMALLAKSLLSIAQVLGEGDMITIDPDIISLLEKEYSHLKILINDLLWDEEVGFYFDLAKDGKRAPVKTAAAFWTLAAEIAPPERAATLAAWLEDKNTFCRAHRVPVCAADEEGYDPEGGYWRGSVWAPMNAMVVYGLKQYGYDSLAKEIALNHLDCVAQVFASTGTIWENYAADSVSSGNADNKDFVGWSGIGPIAFLLEYAIGLKSQAGSKTLHWQLDSSRLPKGPLGCKRYPFAKSRLDLLAKLEGEKLILEISTTEAFTLAVYWQGEKYQYKIEKQKRIELPYQEENL